LEDATAASRRNKSPSGLLRGSIAQICRVIAERLRSLDPSGRQALLRALLTKVSFEGDRIKLIGCLPLDSKPEAASDNLGRIETTTSAHRGHNSASMQAEFIIEHKVL